MSMAMDEMTTLSETVTDREVMDALVTEIKQLRETQETILDKVAAIEAQVKPTLEALSNSPILRMLGAK